MNALLNQHRSLYALDAIGALVSTCLLGIVLPLFQEAIGLPKDVLYILAGCAFGFLLHSSFRYFRSSEAHYLKMVAALNIAYCLFTMYILFEYRSSLEWFGIAYFVGEISLVLLLSLQEWRVARRPAVRN